MDSLNVSQQQKQTGSKASSRSASPCRVRSEHHHAHHTKSLSHGSADSAKVNYFFDIETLTYFLGNVLAIKTCCKL